MTKERADKLLVQKGLVSTRSQAQMLIQKGDIWVSGRPVKKAGEEFEPDVEFQVKTELYVGRGAFKLKAALETFNLSVADLTMVDVGASTGGFTQILLQNNAKKIFAIDVGSDQLSMELRNDSRVINMEKTHILDVHGLDDVIDGAVMDVSFISSKKIIPHVFSLMKEDAFLVLLFKPQFEVGDALLPKDGVIKSDEVLVSVVKDFKNWCLENKLSLRQQMISPIVGKSGNQEFLYLITRSESSNAG